MKPFSAYPEDRAKLLELSRLVATSGDEEDAKNAADALADLVTSILSDEAAAVDMAKMTEEQADEIGQLADRLDTILYSVKLPVSSAIHIQGMSGVIRDVRNELVRIVRANLSYDPWADQDFA
jgi:hypothetical protein